MECVSKMREYATKNIELYDLEKDVENLKHELSQEQCTTQRLHCKLMDVTKERDKQDAEIERMRNEIIVFQRNKLYLEGLADRAADALEDS